MGRGAGDENPPQTKLSPDRSNAPFGGWHHLWDSIIKRVLYTLDFFPEFLADLKTVLGVLRKTTYKAELIKALKRDTDLNTESLRKNANKVRHLALEDAVRFDAVSPHSHYST